LRLCNPGTDPLREIQSTCAIPPRASPPGQIRGIRCRQTSLPAFTPSGLFDGGRKLEFLKEYSGLIILDLDDLQQEQLITARQKIQECTYTYACFISPSGQGLKVLVKVFSRPVLHKRAFNQVKSFYEESSPRSGSSGKDITRLCFVSGMKSCI